MPHFIRIWMGALAALMLFLATSAQAAPVDVNKATQAELQTIKGIGPRMSAKILDERKKGNFKDWNDMVDRVAGVGPGNATKMSAQGLTVNGASYGNAAAVAPSGGPRKGSGTATGVVTTPPAEAKPARK